MILVLSAKAAFSSVTAIRRYCDDVFVTGIRGVFGIAETETDDLLLMTSLLTSLMRTKRGDHYPLSNDSHLLW